MTLLHIVGQLAVAISILKELRNGMKTQTSQTCSKADRPTETGMRSLIRWLPDIVEVIISLLRTLGPWASLAIAWILALLVSLWKGVIPWFGSWLG